MNKLIILTIIFALGQLSLADDRVQFDMYIESLCPDTINFITTSVGPAVATSDFLQIANLNFYPYGNARRNITGGITCQHGPNECYGNKIIACSDVYIPQRKTYLTFVVCFENYVKSFSSDLNKTLAFCAENKSIDLPIRTTSQIYKCANSEEADQLISVIADETDNLIPKHEYVPWVVINGEHNEEQEAEALDNILEFACKTYTGPLKIEACVQFQHSSQ